MMAPLIQSLGITHIHGHFATWAARAASFLSSLTDTSFSFTAHARDIFHQSIDKRELSEKLEKASLKSLLAKYSLQKEVIPLGTMPQGEVIQVLKKAEVFVLPCIVSKDGDQDGLPTVILETMALGTPVISTDIAGIPKRIKSI